MLSAARPRACAEACQAIWLFLRFPPCGAWSGVVNVAPLSIRCVELFDSACGAEGSCDGGAVEGTLSGKQGVPAACSQAEVSGKPITRQLRRRCYHCSRRREMKPAVRYKTWRGLDGSSKGWYVRRISEWRQLGLLRPDIGKKLKRRTTVPSIRRPSHER